MNLNPLKLFSRSAGKAPQGATLTAREADAQGPYTQILSQWTARKIAPALYEALREAIPPIDAAIDRYTTLDGIIRVRGDNDKVVAEIDDWMRNVQVNDLQAGLQQFYRLQSNEAYEQGFTVGEFEIEKSDVVRLRVADSKGIYFERRATGALDVWYSPPAARHTRGDGTDQVEAVLRNNFGAANVSALLDSHGYRKVKQDRLVYYGFNCEADNPYGTSLMRSMPFVARVLLTIDNAVLQTWERFGNPSFDVLYKTKNRRIDAAGIEQRRKSIADNLAKVLSIKRAGNSADFVNAVGADDELALKVIGHDNQVLEIEAPARHVIEQIVSKTGLPSWMLGFHFSTAERLAQSQGVMIIQESKTRFADRLPGLNRVIETMLRARGRTWKAGDWELYQELPNLQDLVAQAQAEFLRAQTELMRGGALPSPRDPAPDLRGTGQRLARVTAGGKIIMPTDNAPAHKHTHKSEQWVEDVAELSRLENETAQALLTQWRALQTDVLALIGVANKSAKSDEPVFIFDAAGLWPQLLELADEFVASVGGEDATLARNMYRAWVRGTLNASAELDVDAIVGDILEQTRARLGIDALDLARNATVRSLRDDIMQALADGLYDGQSPAEVAQALRTRFAAHDVDWERIARSEIAAQQAAGKFEQYAAAGIEQYDWAAAGGACPICTGYAAGGPYSVGSGPHPMRDSHPNCRCTVMAVV